MLASRRQSAKAQSRKPEGMVGDDRKRDIVGLLCQAQQGIPELARRVQLCSCHIKPPETKQGRDQLWRFAHLLTLR
jgi:hypothetical protein